MFEARLFRLYVPDRWRSVWLAMAFAGALAAGSALLSAASQPNPRIFTNTPVPVSSFMSSPQANATNMVGPSTNTRSNAPDFKDKQPSPERASNSDLVQRLWQSGKAWESYSESLNISLNTLSNNYADLLGKYNAVVQENSSLLKQVQPRSDAPGARGEQPSVGPSIEYVQLALLGVIAALLVTLILRQRMRHHIIEQLPQAIQKQTIFFKQWHDYFGQLEDKYLKKDVSEKTATPSAPSITSTPSILAPPVAEKPPAREPARQVPAPAPAKRNAAEVIGGVFVRHCRRGISLDRREVFEADLRKEAGFSAAHVELIYRDRARGTLSLFFENIEDAASPKLYWRVVHEPTSYLLPEPKSPTQFSDLDMQTIFTGPKMTPSTIDRIQPVLLRNLDKGKWAAERPKVELRKDESPAPTEPPNQESPAPAVAKAEAPQSKAPAAPPTPTPPPADAANLREDLGRCFVQFCQENRASKPGVNAGAFEAWLHEKDATSDNPWKTAIVGTCTIKVESGQVYCTYCGDKFQGKKAWVVYLPPGNSGQFLVPAIVEGEWSCMSGFELLKASTPGSITRCLPARLGDTHDRWTNYVVLKNGELEPGSAVEGTEENPPAKEAPAELEADRIKAVCRIYVAFCRSKEKHESQSRTKALQKEISNLPWGKEIRISRTKTMLGVGSFRLELAHPTEPADFWVLEMGKVCLLLPMLQTPESRFVEATGQSYSIEGGTLRSALELRDIEPARGELVHYLYVCQKKGVLKFDPLLPEKPLQNPANKPPASSADQLFGAMPGQPMEGQLMEGQTISAQPREYSPAPLVAEAAWASFPKPTLPWSVEALGQVFVEFCKSSNGSLSDLQHLLESEFGAGQVEVVEAGRATDKEESVSTGMAKERLTNWVVTYKGQSPWLVPAVLNPQKFRDTGFFEGRAVGPRDLGQFRPAKLKLEETGGSAEQRWRVIDSGRISRR